ncbi:MAG: hypothetical protein ABII02_00295 [Candidatus Magasanikbacteria bacterium]
METEQYYSSAKERVSSKSGQQKENSYKVKREDEEGQESRFEPGEQAQQIISLACFAIEREKEVPGKEFTKIVMALAEELKNSSPELVDEKGISEVKRYCNKVQPDLNNLKIRGDLIKMDTAGEGEVGGIYEKGKVAISPNTLRIYDPSKIDEAKERVTFVKEHEEYHKEHAHDQKIKRADSSVGEKIVTIGGESFTEIELVEAINMIDVPNSTEFASGQYKKWAKNLLAAVSRAREEVKIDDVRRAINEKKDVSEIDDEVGEKELLTPEDTLK